MLQHGGSGRRDGFGGLRVLRPATSVAYRGASRRRWSHRPVLGASVRWLIIVVFCAAVPAALGASVLLFAELLGRLR